jgi:hypothetical protein
MWGFAASSGSPDSGLLASGFLEFWKGGYGGAVPPHTPQKRF